LEQRLTLWKQRGITRTAYQQMAELPELKAARPDSAAIHSPVLQDVLTRLDKTYQAFFRRVTAGEQAGFPRSQARTRWHSFTYKQCGTGATLDNGFLMLSTIGRIAVRWSRPLDRLEGTPKTVTISREADGWSVCCSCADVPMQPLPATGQETGIDLGKAAFATVLLPFCYRVEWHAHLPPRLVQERRARAQDGPPAGLTAQAGQPPPSQGGRIARQGASDGAPPAAGLPSLGGSPTHSGKRYDLP
jgi:hypothetical protein